MPLPFIDNEFGPRTILAVEQIRWRIAIDIKRDRAAASVNVIGACKLVSDR